MKLAALLGALALGCLALVGPVEAQTTDVPSGQTLHAIMETPLDSKTANVGDRFTMNVVPPFPAQTDLGGAMIFGHVSRVVRAGIGRRPQLDLAFDRLVYSDGSSVALDARLVSLQARKRRPTPIGVAVETLGGLVLGNVVGKVIFHASGFGLLGAIGGFVYSRSGTNEVRVGEGAQAELTLAEPVRARRQAGS